MMVIPFIYPRKIWESLLFLPCVRTPGAGDGEQSTAAEAVGLETSSVHTHLEGYSHRARGQYDL